MDENAIEDTDVHVTEGMRDENINISDVIEVIETDPDFKPSSTMHNGGDIPGATLVQSRRPSNVYVEIVEQPAPKALRFRYECEGRSAGSIPGASSIPENKTFPSIKVHGRTGKAVVVVSCVTKDPPYRPHPHSLVGREGCKRGVCTLTINEQTMTVVFSNLGIQCVKKKDIESALKVREEIRVDPFRTGFSHRNQPTSIDLNAVRLCFQVFFLDDKTQRYTIPIPPVVSDVIYDKKAMSDLVIIKLSDCNCPVDGGRKDIILLCEKVAKEDIQVHFYEEKDNQVVWEGIGDFQPSQVHKQTAIWFKPPRYRTLEITEPVMVSIQLRRPSDGATSEALPFEYLPLDADYGTRKRKKFDPNVLRQVSVPEQERNLQPQFMLNIPMEPIKTEPRDSTPSPMYNCPLYGAAVSPQYLPPMSSNPSPSGGFTIPYQHQQNMELQQQWHNIPSTSGAPVAVPQNDLDSVTGISSLLDLDNQQLVQDFNLNSQELASYNPNNLSETFSNVSLTDVQQPNDNMTDSLTRLANSALDKMQQ